MNIWRTFVRNTSAAALAFTAMTNVGVSAQEPAKAGKKEVQKVRMDRSDRPAYLQGEILVSFHSAPAFSSAKTNLHESTFFSSLGSSFSIKRVSPVFAAPPSQAKAAAHTATYKLEIDLRAGATMDQALAEVERNGDVAWAEFNYIATIDVHPDDARYDEQNYLGHIKAHKAWNTTTGSREVVVAVIDTGFDMDHPDLVDNLWVNDDEIAGDGIDNDNNGYVDDVHGYDFVSVDASEVSKNEDPGPRDNNPDDHEGHGTHVNGIVGAKGNNGIGVSGINWDVSLMAVRAGYKTPGGGGSLAYADIADAIRYAVDNGADVLNFSFGGPWSSSTLLNAIDYAASRGVVMVAAAGNEITDLAHYPSSYPSVLSVAATRGSSGRHAEFSNYGYAVDISAPGKNILSTKVKGDYVKNSGTSMASPVIAGAVALLKAADPTLTDVELMKRLLSTAKNIDAANPDYIGLLGAGQVNLKDAIESSSNPTNVALAHVELVEVSGDLDNELEVGDVVDLIATVKNFSDSIDVTLSLETTDPYIQVMPIVSQLNNVRFRTSKSNNESPLRFQVLPGAPNDYQATVTVNGRYNGETLFATPVQLHLVPTFRREHSYATDWTGGHTGTTMTHALPGGGLATTYVDSSQYNRQQVQLAVRDFTGAWQVLEVSKELQNSYTTASKVDSQGNLHIVYESWTSQYGRELYYRTYQLATGTLTPEIQLTTDSDSIGSADVAVDDQGNTLIVWVDHVNDETQIHYKYHDGVSWSPVSTATIVDDSYYADLHLEPRAAGGFHLMYIHGISVAPYEAAYHAVCLNGVFSVPTEVDRFDTGAIVGQGSDIYSVSKQGTFEMIELKKFNGIDFDYVRDLIIDDEDFFTYSMPFDFSLDQHGFVDFAISRDNPETYGNTLEVLKETSLGTWQIMPTHTNEFIVKDELFMAKGTLGYTHLTHPQGPLAYVFENGQLIYTEYYVDQLAYTTDQAINAAYVPPRPVVTDEGATTSENNTLNFSWTCDFDDVAYYRYALGTAPGGQDIQSWTKTTQDQIGVYIGNTPLKHNQTYYLTVVAYSNGVYSSLPGFSDGIKYKQ